MDRLHFLYHCLKNGTYYVKGLESVYFLYTANSSYSKHPIKLKLTCT